MYFRCLTYSEIINLIKVIMRQTDASIYAEMTDATNEVNTGQP